VTRHTLTGPTVASVRRDVGPVAWCALEVLIERSPDGRTSVASVRVVATELGVAKNTAHRALAVLARAALVEAMQERDPGGRFRTGRYRLRIDHLLTSTTPTKNTHHRHTTSTPNQLTLITPP
jgi:DNA-binding IclR family transcriptional regulator